MKTDLENLEKAEELREVLYHLKEIAAAQEKLGELLRNLNESYRNDDEATAKVLNEIEIEAVDHVGYHVREVRVPLRALVTSAFESLEEDSGK